jgi:hypothetical protein
VINAVNSAPAPSEPITSLAELKVRGAVAGVNGAADDSIAVSAGSVSGPIYLELYTASGTNYFPDLGNQWQTAEFNVLGDSNGDQANFNTGSTIVGRTIVDDRTTDVPCVLPPPNAPPNAAPICPRTSYTAEKNNLNLGSCYCVGGAGTSPAIVFTQSNAPAGGGADLAAWGWCYSVNPYINQITFNAIIKNVGSRVWKPSTTGHLKIGVTSGPHLAEISRENPCTLDAYPNFPALDPGMVFKPTCANITVDFNPDYVYEFGGFVLYHPEDINPANDELVIQRINEKGQEFLPNGKLYEHDCSNTR